MGSILWIVMNDFAVIVRVINSVLQGTRRKELIDNQINVNHSPFKVYAIYNCVKSIHE